MEKQIRIARGRLSSTTTEVSKYARAAISKELPNAELVTYHRRRKDGLSKELSNIHAFLAQKDKHIEKWFPKAEEEIANSNRKVPDLEFFQAVYEQEKQVLINNYKGREVTQFRISKTWDPRNIIDDNPESKVQEIENILPLRDPTSIVTEEQCRQIQKQFWLMKGMLDILEAGKMQTLSKFRFLRTNQRRKNVFTVHPIEIEGTIDYEHIPGLIQKILNSEYFMTQVTDIIVKKDRDYIPENIVINVPWNENSTELEREQKAKSEYFEKNKGISTSPPVFLSLGCEVLDYENKTK